LKDFFVPSSSNNYRPKLLSKIALYFYLFFILFGNLSLNLLSPQKAGAEINVNQIYDLQNIERRKLSLPDLTINTLLIESATAKAKAMLSSDCWSHYCPNGKSPWDFFDDAGYQYIYAGENLAEGFTDVNKLMQAWMNSPTHRANILNKNFTEVGIGYAYGKFQGNDNNMIIVVHFGARADTNEPKVLPNTGVNDSSAVKFIYPIDGQYINKTNVTVRGTAPIGSNVNLIINGTSIGKALTTNGNFELAAPNILLDGNYSIYGEAYDTHNQFIGTSRNINFTILSHPPVANLSKLIVTSVLSSGKDVLANFDYSDPEIKTLQENMTGTSANRDSNDKIALEVNVSVIQAYNTVDFTITDYAGNMTQFSISSKDLMNIISTKSSLIYAQSFSSFVNYIQINNIKLGINWGFVSFLTTLFGIDFFFLSKTGLTNITRSKSHLNFIIFFILFVILLIGISTGNVLTGATV